MREPTFRAEVDEYCAVRREQLTVQPAGDGLFEMDVRWKGQESMLRAVFLRRVLARAGVEAQPTSSEGGEVWGLHIEPVPAERVGELIHSCIW
jgi:hypothetical protein